MRSLLDTHSLTTVYNSDFAYFWNINTSYNKSDGFLKKQIEILDEKGRILLSSDLRKFSIKELKPGKYQIWIRYTFDVPKSYQDQMLALQEKYGIKMGDREKYILALQDKNAVPTDPRQRWANRELIYLPFSREIGEISGDAEKIKTFKSDFAQGISYLTRILQNPKTNEVRINIQVK